MAGINGKSRTVFKCLDCGLTTNSPMSEDIKLLIDIGVDSLKGRENLFLQGTKIDWEVLTKNYVNIETGMADREQEERERREREEVYKSAQERSMPRGERTGNREEEVKKDIVYILDKHEDRMFSIGEIFEFSEYIQERFATMEDWERNSEKLRYLGLIRKILEMLYEKGEVGKEISERHDGAKFALYYKQV